MSTPKDYQPLIPPYSTLVLQGAGFEDESPGSLRKLFRSQLPKHINIRTQTNRGSNAQVSSYYLRWMKVIAHLYLILHTTLATPLYYPGNNA